MRDLFGFGGPLDQTPMIFQPGILSMAWWSVVRQIAAALGLTLDQSLVERVERVPADRDIDTASVFIEKGTQGAVRFEVVGQVDGEPRVALEHVTRTSPEQMPEWPHPPDGDGCYRVRVTGEPQMVVDLVHRGEHGRPQRLRNDHHRDAAGERGRGGRRGTAGLVTAAELPLITGRGLVRH